MFSSDNMELPESLRKQLKVSEEETEFRKKNLPKALKIQKRRFLCAIGKAEPSPTEAEDESFLKKFNTTTFAFGPNLRTRETIFWKDTIATEMVNNILKEHQNFDLCLYLDCAKAIYLTYSGIIHTQDLYKALTYVLTHARLFGNPTRNVFQLEKNGSFQITFKDISKPLPNCIYMSKITELIKALQNEFNETKYMILNTNVTYLSLLILRRFVKNEVQFKDAFKRINTHDDYVKLCPNPLCNQLPTIADSCNKNLHDKMLKNSVILAIHAFLTVDDATTKQVLRATCLQYIEWTGLHLPNLFFQVVKLYGIEEGELWKTLCYPLTYESLFKLTDDYYKLYKMSKADPPEATSWFLYCRALEGDFHKNLSGLENKRLCLLLAYIIDLKRGFDRSFIRNSHWVTKNYTVAGDWLSIAKEFHNKYNKPE